MAVPQQKPQPLRCIERHIAMYPNGRYRVSVRVGGTLYRRSFPAKSSIHAMRTWVSRTKFLERWRHVKDLPPPVQALERSPEGWCYLYVVLGDGAVKIGKATDPKKRLAELQTGHPLPLTIIAAVPAHAALEDAAHTRFQHLRTTGEWFTIDAELEAFIGALQRGVNPIALLWDTMRQPKTPQTKPPKLGPKWKFRNDRVAQQLPSIQQEP